MACAPEWVTAYVDGELDEPSRELMERHVAGCQRCRAQVGEERTLHFRLRSLPDPRPSPSFEQRFAPRHVWLN
jgi:anti-sigma factor RsiW